MSKGTSNRTTLSFIKEVTPGVTPASPALQLLRFTGESLESANTTTQSEEIRDDRGTSDLILTDQSNSGDINAEVSGATFDEFILAALMSDTDWSSVDVSASTISATATGFDDSGNGFVVAGLEVGQVIKFSGFANGAINKPYYRITSISAGSINTYPVPTATVAEGDSVTYKGSTAKSGKTDRSYTIQKAFKDVSPVVYRNFRGMRVSTMSQQLSVGAIAQMSFGFMGLTSENTEDVISGQTEVQKTATELMNCVGDVTQITAVGNGVTQALDFTDLTLSYDNSLRELKAIGQLGSIDVRPGTIVATATINPYFENKELLDAFLNNSSFVLSWAITGSDGYAYVFQLPKVKFISQSLAAGSKDQDMIVSGQVQAIIDPASGVAGMRVDRFTP